MNITVAFSFKYASISIKGWFRENNKMARQQQKDLMTFPKEVIQEMGYALYCAQHGGHYKKAKPFKGHGVGVYEIASEYNKNAYRAIYMISKGEIVYVIHCFQKKSKSGIKTPKEELAVISQQLKLLRAIK